MIRYFHGFQSIDELDFEKVDGLMPAIVQDCQTGQVLMMGYMTKESLQKTLDTGFVTFSQEQDKSFGLKVKNQVISFI